MEPIFFLAAIYLFIAVIAAVISYHLHVSIALVEICLGVAAAAVADRFFGTGSLGGSQQWLQFLASAGAVLLTFLAGAELDPVVMRTKLREVSVVGIVGFVAPFTAGPPWRTSSWDGRFPRASWAESRSPPRPWPLSMR